MRLESFSDILENIYFPFLLLSRPYPNTEMQKQVATPPSCVFACSSKGTSARLIFHSFSVGPSTSEDLLAYLYRQSILSLRSLVWLDLSLAGFSFEWLLEPREAVRQANVSFGTNGTEDLDVMIHKRLFSEWRDGFLPYSFPCFSRICESVLFFFINTLKMNLAIC